jgi:C-terminal processing protease CtpA/Prc
MAFGIGKWATVIGEQTAGTNGDVIRFWLPGNIQTMISGVGIYYPDGKEVQRAGVKIDIPVSYTKEAIVKGRDAILEKTIDMIVSGETN